jgi:hypothetical protein
MSEFVASGRIVDLVLAVVAIEAALLFALRRRLGRGPRPADILAMLLPGVCLMLALRAALTGAWWGAIAVALAAAFLAHLADLSRRFGGG